MRLTLILDISKAIVAMYVGLFCLLVGYNNLIDYNTNFQFVEHVMAMDEMKSFFKGGYERAITSPVLHTVFYHLIIALEFLAGAFCVIGAEWFSMWVNHWNGQIKSYTFAIFIILTLIYILMPSSN